MAAPVAGLGLAALGPLGLAALATGVGSTIAAAQAPGGVSFTTSDRGIQRRPIESNALADALQVQAGLQLGVDPSAIAEDLIIRRAAQSGNPIAGRRVQREVGAARQRLAAGDIDGARQDLQAVNRFSRNNLNDPVTAGNFVIRDGRIVFESEDPFIRPLLESATAEASRGIFENRLAALSNIAEIAGGLPVLTEEDIRAREEGIVEQLLAELNRDVSDIEQQIIERANVLGVAPRLDRVRESQIEESQRIRSETGLQRALELLQGELALPITSATAAQSLLQATLSSPALQGASLSRGAAEAGLEFGRRLAVADAKAEAARAAGIANSLGGLNATLLSLGGFNEDGSNDENGQLSSSSLSRGLGVGDIG